VDSLEALDRVYLRLAEGRLLRDPWREAEDRAYLRGAVEFYRKLGRRRSNQPRVRQDAALAHARLGALYLRLGQTREARESLAEATARLEGLLEEVPGDRRLLEALARCFLHRGTLSLKEERPEGLRAALPSWRRARRLYEQLATRFPGDLE